MAHNVLCGIQARLDSKRFPKKCFALLDGKPILRHVLERCLLMKSPAKVVLLVPQKDQAIFAEFLQKEELSVDLFGGCGEDILARYEAAAQYFSWRGAIMRVTGDNPLISVVLADRLAQEFSGSGIAHYIGNPLGTGVEIFGRADLARAAAEAKDPYEREHCTPYFYRNPDLFKVAELPCPLEMPNIPVTIDTPEELAFVEAFLKSSSFNE